MTESKAQQGRRQGRRLIWIGTISVVVLIAVVVTVVLILAGGNKANMPTGPSTSTVSTS